MGLFDRMYSIKKQEPTHQYDEGCVRCGKLRFDYDPYHDEYVCDDCGWAMGEKPNGEIEIKEKDVAVNGEQSPYKGKDESESQDMPLEEMNKIVQDHNDLNCLFFQVYLFSSTKYSGIGFCICHSTIKDISLQLIPTSCGLFFMVEGLEYISFKERFFL